MSGAAVADLVALGVFAWGLWTAAALAYALVLVLRRMLGRGGR